MNIDRIAGIILFLFGLVICIESLSYQLKSAHSFGAFFLAMLASLFLMLLSGVMIINSFLKKDKSETPKAPFFIGKEAPKRILIGLISLLAFRYLLPVIGFGPSTFLFIFSLAIFLGHYNWKVSIFFSALTALVTYFLFQVFFKVPTPIGILGF